MYCGTQQDCLIRMCILDSRANRNVLNPLGDVGQKYVLRAFWSNSEVPTEIVTKIWVPGPLPTWCLLASPNTTSRWPCHQQIVVIFCGENAFRTDIHAVLDSTSAYPLQLTDQYQRILTIIMVTVPQYDISARWIAFSFSLKIQQRQD